MALLFPAAYQFLDSNGDPVGAGKLFCYDNGTTNAVSAYSNPDLSTGALSSPIVLDSAGRLTTNVYLDGTKSYTVKLDTSADAELWSRDDVPTINGGAVSVYDPGGNDPRLDFYQDDQSTRNAYIDAGSDGILEIHNDLPSGEFRVSTETSGGTSWAGLRIKKAGDLGDVDGTGAVTTKMSFANGEKFWFEHTGAGDSGDLDQASVGLYLTSSGMNTTSRHTPAIIFGSSDSQFTTENPKALAGIVGRCTEVYDDDTDGGMGIAFYISNNTTGASPTLTEAAYFDQNGGLVVGSPTGTSGNGAGTINAVGVYDDNSLLTDYVFDAYLDGSIDFQKYEETKKHEPARAFDYDDLDPEKYINKWQISHKLSAFDDGNDNPSLGETVQKLTETVEVQAVHIAKLLQRIEDLENA